jgi:hypothetical protein
MRRNPRFLLIFLTGLQLDEPETRVAISIALRARAMLGM